MFKKRKKSKFLKKGLLLIVFILLILIPFYYYIQIRKVVLEHRAIGPKPVANFLDMEIKESSGLIRSSQEEDYFWTHGDSVGSDKIPKTYLNGFRYNEKGISDSRLVYIDGTINIDWESLAKDDHNNFLVGDIGNTVLKKRYTIYRIKEPEKDQKTIMANDVDIIVYQYPGENELNSEAMFYADKSIYILTKEYGKTNMYRLLDRDIELRKINSMEYVGEFKFLEGKKITRFLDAVTGADVSDDELTMVMTTYMGIYMFKRKNRRVDFFEGEIYYLPLEWNVKYNQYEALAFTKDQKSIMLTSEQGYLYKVDIKDFKKIRESSNKEIEGKKEVRNQKRKSIKYKLRSMFSRLQYEIMDLIFR